MLEIQDLHIEYNRKVCALSSSNATLEEGKIYGIIGPSGAGKTSFLKGILGLINCTGKVLFRGKPMKEFAKSIAFLEQKENIDRDFPITVFQCVLLGTYPSLGLFKRPKKTEKQKAKDALKEVDMWEFKDRQIGELSGGQFQRVLIARALAQKALLLFLDEPFVGVDVNNEAKLIAELKKLRDNGITIFVVHHNLQNVNEYFDDVILINQKIIDYGSVATTFTPENLQKTYLQTTIGATFPFQKNEEKINATCSS